MIVITRNGKTTVITGWRAWLVGTVVFLAAWLVFAVLVFFWIGAALTLGGAGYAARIEPRWIRVERRGLRLPRLPRAFDGFTLAPDN